MSQSIAQTQQLLAEAHAQRRRGEYDEAINLCTRVLRQEPEHPDALALLGDIYRELGNYREALGWYQLAVQHSNGRPAVQKRLDEMIERVFPGNAASAQRPLPPPSALQQPPTSRARQAAGPSLLARIQPVHVVILFAVLAMIGVLIVILASGHHAAADTQKPPPRKATTPIAENDGNSAVVMPPTQPSVSTPQPDAVESGPNATTPSTPIRPTPTANPPVTQPPTPTGTSPATGNIPLPSTISPPAPAANPSLTSESLEKQTQQLKALLDSVAKGGKLQYTVNGVEIDPRTGVVRIDYTIPRMENPAETKKGLLYAGFQLIWATLRQSTEQRTFALRGSACVGVTRTVTTALVADVTWQQMENAHSAGDYKAIQQYLTNPWWRDDLFNIAVGK